MKQFINVIFVIFILSSCSKNNKLILPEELELYLSEIGKVQVFSIDRSRIYGILDGDEGETRPLYTEEKIRRNGNLFIFYNTAYSNQAKFIAVLLYISKKVNIDNKKNIPQTINKDGIAWLRDSGCVIDIYDRGDNIIKTYIMKNGLEVFYEKGKDNIFYEMPKILLDKFSISTEEFLWTYNKIK